MLHIAHPPWRSFPARQRKRPVQSRERRRRKGIPIHPPGCTVRTQSLRIPPLLHDANHVSLLLQSCRSDAHVPWGPLGGAAQRFFNTKGTAEPPATVGCLMSPGRHADTPDCRVAEEQKEHAFSSVACLRFPTLASANELLPETLLRTKDLTTARVLCVLCEAHTVRDGRFQPVNPQAEKRPVKNGENTVYVDFQNGEKTRYLTCLWTVRRCGSELRITWVLPLHRGNQTTHKTLRQIVLTLLSLGVDELLDITSVLSCKRETARNVGPRLSAGICKLKTV
ncbi:hypothetical protein TGCAST_209200B [Toxoplasma gondii CAST]|uniref:Uncharacterized protein n=1 Tax=Toxoplasma gondii CAST TaxID=943122 RepID=A0A3R8BSH0_TOXGO|nr:hypothetical protein TGCAST_209200B [Toxoplasma gondii CAST]